MVRIVALMAVAALAATPAAALAAAPAATPAQSLLGTPPQQQAPAPAQEPAQQQAPAQQPQTTTERGSLSGAQVLLIALAVVALIGGIWFAIARDARRATAGRVRAADAELLGGRGGSATRAARRSRKLSAAEKQRRKRGRAH